MPSFAELLNKYMEDKKFTDGSLEKAINSRIDEILEQIKDPGHPLRQRWSKAEKRKKVGMTIDDFVVSRATIYAWRIGQTRHPQWREVIVTCGKILELPPEHLDEFLIAAGHQPIHSITLPPPPSPGRNCITVVGKPIVQPYQFFGRTSLLGKIRWAWNKDIPEHVVVIGPRRSGKTSLLNYLKNILQADCQRPGQPQGWDGWLPRNFQFVLVDFQKEVMWKPEGFRKEVLQQLQPKESSEPPTVEHFANVLKGQIGMKTVILMDEFNVGWERLSEDFWLNMRALGASGNVSFMLASSKNFAELVAKNHSQSSPFFNIFAHTLTLGPFTDSEARELIAHSPKDKKLAEVEWMLRESHCWPALLQLLCDTQLQALETGEQNWQEEGLKRLKDEHYRHLLELPGDGR